MFARPYVVLKNNWQKAIPIEYKNNKSLNVCI